MSDDQFMKLFKYVEETRAEVREIKEEMATKDNIRRLERMILYLAEKAHVQRDVLETI